MDTKRKTVGVDPKVPAQLVASAIVWALAHFAGVDLSPEVEVAIAVVIGAAIGALAPAAKTVPANQVATVESGTSHTRVP